jgi:hypothetical protein
MSQPPRPFFLPTIGLTLLFALFGPAIGGALFAPIALSLAAPAAAHVAGPIGWAATLAGHTFALIVAYLFGVGPAAATGFVYALWDAAAPIRAPRALVAALIGGAMAYALFHWLASLGASIEAAFDVTMTPPVGDWIEATLRHGFVACGAVAGFVCALAASLLGLTTRGALIPARPAPVPPEGLMK